MEKRIFKISVDINKPKAIRSMAELIASYSQVVNIDTLFPTHKANIEWIITNLK